MKVVCIYFTIKHLTVVIWPSQVYLRRLYCRQLFCNLNHTLIVLLVTLCDLTFERISAYNNIKPKKTKFVFAILEPPLFTVPVLVLVDHLNGKWTDLQKI